MYNPRTTNARQDSTEADCADNTSTELDVLLQENPVPAGDADINQKHLLVEDAPRDDEVCTHFAGLQLRASHVTESLNIALGSICEMQELADKERLTAGRFVAEMHHWDRMLDRLERYIRSPLPGSATSEAEGSSIAEKDKRVEELLQAIKAQEDKIQELELRLDKNDTRATKPQVNRLLVVVMGDKNLKYPLTTAIVTIGRSNKNDIQLRSSHASRHHARILTDDRYTYIEDLDSANGIMVNSERVTRQQLHSGDIINAGRIQIKYIDLMEGSAGEGQA